MKKRKALPNFRDEEEEHAFWATHDSTAYFDWSKAVRAVFPNLQPSTHTISLRLPESLLSDLKVLANRLDVPYQSLMKLYLAERVAREISRGKSPDELAAEVREPAAPYGQAKPLPRRKVRRPK